MLGVLNRFRRQYRKSYAQSGEDIIVDYLLRGVLRIDRPTYLDVGAHDAKHLSNTYLFYRMGLSGVCVETNPVLCSRIKRARPRDKCLNVGVGIDRRSEADFYVMQPATLSTFSREFVDQALTNPKYELKRTVRIPLIRLHDIIEEHFDRCPEFVSIDVEGLDLDIVRGFDFERYRPQVICIESVTHVSEEKIDGIFQRMSDVDYIVYGDTFINTIFVEKSVWDRRKEGN